MEAALPAHGEHARSPIDVVKLQGNDLTCPQAKSCDQEKEGAIPAVDATSLTAAVDYPLDILCVNVFRQSREAPRTHRRHRSGQVRVGLALLEQEAEEGTQRRDHELGLPSRRAGSVTKQEVGHVIWRELTEPNGTIAVPLKQEPLEDAPVAPRCHWR